jgi:hypothetical protein
VGSLTSHNPTGLQGLLWDSFTFFTYHYEELTAEYVVGKFTAFYSTHSFLISLRTRHRTLSRWIQTRPSGPTYLWFILILSSNLQLLLSISLLCLRFPTKIVYALLNIHVLAICPVSHPPWLNYLTYLISTTKIHPTYRLTLYDQRFQTSAPKMMYGRGSGWVAVQQVPSFFDLLRRSCLSFCPGAWFTSVVTLI